MVKTLIVLIVFFQAISAYSSPVIMQFNDHGKKVRTLTLDEMQKIQSKEEVTVIEPHMGIRRTYTAVNMNKLLDKVYGKKWQTTDELLFTCSDGYQPSVPVEEFKENPSYLAFGLKDSREFTVENKLQNEKRVELGPFYLVWDNIKGNKQKDDTSSWPYQVVSVDLIDFRTKFPNLSPPQGTSAQVQKGFLAFRKNCMTCHSVNGDGGKKAIDLNNPNVTTYISDKNLAAWIDNPAKVRPGTAMPALNHNIKNRDQVISNIIAYLKAMKK